MNKLKQMVIKSIEDAQIDGIFKESIKDDLLNNVDDYCDKIIDCLLRNGNVEIKSNISIYTGDNFKYRWKPFLYIDVVNNPISQEDYFLISDLISFVDKNERS